MSFLLMLVAVFLWVIAAILVIAEEQFLGIDALGYAILGLPFFGLAQLVGSGLPDWVRRP